MDIFIYLFILVIEEAVSSSWLHSCDKRENASEGTPFAADLGIPVKVEGGADGQVRTL